MRFLPIVLAVTLAQAAAARAQATASAPITHRELVTTSVSPAIDVRIVLRTPDTPLYTVTLTNRSARAVRALQFKYYRGDKEIGVGRRKANRGIPALDAHGRTEFTIEAASDDGPQGFDRFAVTGVLWDDWSVDGDEQVKTSEAEFAAGEAQQLRRVIALLQDQSIASIAALRARVHTLPVQDRSATVFVAQQQVRDAVLADLNSVPTPAWRQEAMARYVDWLSRISRR